MAGKQNRAQGKIPLTGSGALTESRQRRWFESFGISLVPVVGLVIARLISSGISVHLLNPVDLSIAMLAAAAVLAVQLLDAVSTHRLNDPVAPLILIIFFAMAFSTISGVAATKEDSGQSSLEVAATQGAKSLQEAEQYVGVGENKNLTEVSLLQEKLRLECNSANLSENVEEVH
ncbi:hypothetical protein, partial [Frankia sp. AgB1.8]|uniref:hypothetical protein n=1 Tax=Frankia sp. AgB1.8 TaxID=2792839 RepID=UPI001932AFD7